MNEQHDDKNMQYVPVQMMPRDVDDDEIDLLELWRTLMQKKWVVLGITLACILAGAAYALLATPVYETKVYFSPPRAQDVAALNILSLNTNGYTERYAPDAVYQMFLQNLRSRKLRKKFFDDQGILSIRAGNDKNADAEQIFEKQFNEKLVLKKEGSKRAKNTPFYSLRFEGAEASRIAHWTNAFVSMVMDSTRDTLIGNVMADKNNQVNYLTKAIAGKKKAGRTLREDQIVRLKEALGIARKLKITQDKFSGSDVQPATIYNIGISYLRGTKTLGVQLQALQNRTSDDPYISGLRELQKRLDLIKMITIAPEHIHVANIDQPAMVPGKPVKPKKTLIVTLAGVVGLCMGIFFVFFLNFVQNAKKREEA